MNMNSVSAKEHMDVLIIGAGISGIGIARYLLKTHPHRQFQILEARERLGEPGIYFAIQVSARIQTYILLVMTSSPGPKKSRLPMHPPFSSICRRLFMKTELSVIFAMVNVCALLTG